MGLAASMSYSSSRSGGGGGGGSFPGSHSNRGGTHTSLDTVIGGISPDDDDDQEKQDSSEQDESEGLPTIRESSRSSSNTNLLTPRVSHNGKTLAGRPEDDLSESATSGGGGGDISPRNASGSGAGPSGLSLMLSRSEASPGKKGVGLGEGGGTDELASGASGVLGVLPEVPRATGEWTSLLEPRGTLLNECGVAQEIGSSVTSSLTVRPVAKTTHSNPRSSSSLPSPSPASSPGTSDGPPTERTPLLSTTSETHHLQGTHDAKPRSAHPVAQKHHAFGNARESIRAAVGSVRKATWKDVGQQVFVEPVKLLPATVLGCLLNVLDGVSYGMIMYVRRSRQTTGGFQ